MLQDLRNVPVESALFFDEGERSVQFGPNIAGIVFSALLSQERPGNDPGFIEMDECDDSRFEEDGSLRLTETDLRRAIVGLGLMYRRLEGRSDLGSQYAANRVRAIGRVLAREMAGVIEEAEAQLELPQTPDGHDSAEWVKALLDAIREAEATKDRVLLTKQ